MGRNEAEHGSPSRGSCPFCARIAVGETVAESALAVAIRDAFPLSIGHTLVVSRRHEPEYFSLSEAEQQAMWHLANVVREGLDVERRPVGYNLGVNVGEAAGQTIGHAHVHVIPRYAGDSADPRGGVRWVIPGKPPYWKSALARLAAPVVGVDGCRGGWFAVRLPAGGGRVSWTRLAAVADVLEWAADATVVAVDMPIGLLDEASPGGREVDREARRLLGRRRGSSAFSPPVRAALGCSTYAEALAANRATSVHRIGISIQAYGLVGKLRELDGLMTPALQERVREVHPELSFRAMNGGEALAEGKKTVEGRAARLALLVQRGLGEARAALERVPRSQAGPDDVLDAFAAAWTAARIVSGEAVRIPADPPTDSRGLRAELWY